MKGGKKKSGGGTSSSEAVQLPLPAPIADEDGGEAAETHRDGDELAAAEDQAEQQHQGEGEGEGDGEEGEEEEEGEGYDEFEDLQIEDGKDEAERPKLAEGFYEIEAVRRKRVRKGEVQYLIKWRGWPETANTWEPIDNLMSCSDVIDAFEESLRSGKHRSSRRRKRKYGGPHYQPKKQQQQQQHSPAAATYNIPAVQVRIMDEPLPSIPVNVSIIANKGENNVGAVSEVEAAKQANENDPTMVPQQIEERNEQNELDLKLSELKGTMATNEGNGDKFAIHFPSARTSEGNGAANGLLKVDNVEQAQAGRCTGAKRRKSGSVKRFKQDSASCVPNDAQNALSRSTDVSSGRVGRQGIQNPNSMGNDLGLKNKYDNSINMFTITEIIKPISYSASVSNNVQDVLVTFMAMRSDGKEVIVDNKFLKANNPLLLINFYEQHLRYSPT